MPGKCTGFVLTLKRRVLLPRPQPVGVLELHHAARRCLARPRPIPPATACLRAYNPAAGYRRSPGSGSASPPASQHRRNRTYHFRMHPVSIARPCSLRSVPPGQVHLDRDGLAPHLSCRARRSDRTSASRPSTRVLIVGAHLGNRHRRRRCPTWRPLRRALRVRRENRSGGSSNPPRQPAPPRHRPVCVFHFVPPSRTTPPHRLSLGIVTSVRPSSARTTSSTSPESGVTSRAAPYDCATRIVISRAGKSE